MYELTPINMYTHKNKFIQKNLRKQKYKDINILAGVFTIQKDIIMYYSQPNTTTLEINNHTRNFNNTLTKIRLHRYIIGNI